MTDMGGWGRKAKGGFVVLNVLLVFAFISETPVSHAHFLAPILLTHIQNDAFTYANFHTSDLTASIKVIQHPSG